MKKIILLGVIITTILMVSSAAFVSARAGSSDPFSELWSSVDELLDRTERLEEEVDELQNPEEEIHQEMFLKLEGIDGESRDQTHKDEIDVLAWSWGMSQSGSFHVGGGGGAGKANFQDISITKYIDKATPDLMLYTSNGDHIRDATLTVRKAGGEPVEYLVIEMKKVLVTSVSTGGSGGEDRLTENVVLNFAEVKVKYTEQKDDGSTQTHEYSWNIAENKEG
jgi:type VI secretion system secreted protein Hcp